MMLQLINKKRIYFYIFSLLFLSTFTNYNFIKFFDKKFIIDKIEINVNSDVIKKSISLNTNYLINKNIFKVDKANLINILENKNYLEDLKIKKNYPSSISIKAKKTDLIALTYINQKKYYLGSNGKFILSKEIPNEKKLPVIFGNFKVLDLFYLKKILDENKIDYNEVNKYYFHKNKRWDLYFNNNIIIKLPHKNLNDALIIYKKFLINEKIKPGTTVDLRVQNRLVLNNE